MHSVFNKKYSNNNSQERRTPVKQKKTLGPQVASLLTTLNKLPASECPAPRRHTILSLLLLLIFTTSTQAQKLEFAGILGNSGEQGKSLANFSLDRPQKLDDGMGIIYDKLGTLWASAGGGQINRYSLDGRLLASFTYPASGHSHTNNMLLCDDKIIIFSKGTLFSLPVDATPGSAATKLSIKVKTIGHSNSPGVFPALTDNKEIFLVKSDGSIKSKIVTLKDEPWNIFLQKDGTINYVHRGLFRTIKNGKLIEEANPLKFPGSNMQKIGKNWYAHAWHGTIKRLDDNMAPDPGIVLGGSSGSFIGHLAGNYEVNQGKAMARINKNLYAIGGAGNIIHLMEWKEKEGRFELLRRIGPLSQVNGSLAMDEDGRILIPNGNWLWSDSPDTPLRNSTGREGNGQVSFINDIAIGSSYIYGSSPALSYGKLSGELKTVHDPSKKYGFMKSTTGFTVLKKGGKHIAYFTNGKGNTSRLQVNYLGQPEKKLGSFKLSVKTPVKSWTTFAKINDDKVLAGADGYVIELDTSNASTWKETKRWKNFSSDSFGSEIHISADKNNLWVADSERHRILCFDLLGKLLTTYGKKDAAGADFTHFKTPTAISGNSKRVVVYDEGNQRLVKLELK